MPSIPAFGRQREEDLYKLEASLTYRSSSRTAKLHRETLFCEEQQQKKPLSWPDMVVLAYNPSRQSGDADRS